MADLNPKRLNKIMASFIVVVWNVPLIISILRQLYCSPLRDSLLRSIKPGIKYSSCFMFCGLITSHCAHLALLLLFDPYSDRQNLSFIATSTIFYIGFAIAFLAIYTFMVYRLYYVFKRSMYRLSRCAVRLHAAVVISSCVVFLSSAVIYELAREVVLFYTALGLSVIWMAIGFAHLVWTFNSNLLHLVVSQRRSFHHGHIPQSTPTSQLPLPHNHSGIVESQSHSLPSTVPPTSSGGTGSRRNTIGSSVRNLFSSNSRRGSVIASFNGRQRMLLQTIIKHTVLGGQMMGAIVVFVAVTVAVTQIGDDDLGEVLFWWAQALCTCVVTTSVYLSYRMNHGYYEAVCSVCDKRCGVICEWCANRRSEADVEMARHVHVTRGGGATPSGAATPRTPRTPPGTGSHIKPRLATQVPQHSVTVDHEI